MIRKLTENKVLVYSLILTIIVLSIIPAVRFFYYDNLLVGEEPYYHIRMARYILEKGIPSNDVLVDSPYLFQPLHLILAGVSFLGLDLASFLVPYLFGILSVILLNHILKGLKVPLVNRFFILFILIISPIFIFTFSTLNSYLLPVFILLLAFFFFIEKKKPLFFRKKFNIRKKIYHVLSLILFAVLPFFDIITFLFGLSVIFIYTLNNWNKLKGFYNILFISVIIALIRYVIYIIKYGLPYISFNSTLLANYLSELGGLLSFGVFNIILAAMGLYLMWNNKKQISGYILLFIAVILSLYFNPINIYLNFIFAVTAGYAFVSFVKMHYSLAVIKKLTIILLLVGLLFSTISYTARVSNILPDTSVVDSFEWLKSNSNQEDIIFSHYTKGNWIQTISKRKVLLNSNLIYIEDAKSKLNASETIFYSRTLKKTVSLLDEYNISYIWIDSEMKKGLVWTEEDEGLLFLFSNKEEFRKVYDKGEIEIWKVLRES